MIQLPFTIPLKIQKKYFYETNYVLYKTDNSDSQMKCNQQNTNVNIRTLNFNLLDAPCVLNFLQQIRHAWPENRLKNFSTWY